MTEPKELKEILEFFEELSFPSCPIKEKEPFWWKWTKEGKNIIKSLLRQTYFSAQKAEREKIVEMVKGMKIQIGYENGKHSGKSFCPQCEDCGYNDALSDILTQLRK
jgi:hypothetical protein